MHTGALLRRTRLSTSVEGFPVSLRVGGRQYIAAEKGLGAGSLRQMPRSQRRASMPVEWERSRRVLVAGLERPPGGTRRAIV